MKKVFLSLCCALGLMFSGFALAADIPNGDGITYAQPAPQQLPGVVVLPAIPQQERTCSVPARTLVTAAVEHTYSTLSPAAKIGHFDTNDPAGYTKA